jgi:transposase
MSKRVPVPSKEELENEYHQYGVSISSLARKYNTTNPTVRVWLQSYNIARKDHKQASTEANNRKRIQIPDKFQLENLYKNKSIKQLELIFGVGQETIYTWLEYHNIEIKTLSEACKDGKERIWNDLIPTKKELESAYKEVKSVAGLQEQFNLSINTLRKALKQYNIEIIDPLRSAAEEFLFKQLNSLSDKTWRSCDRSIIAPYELDLVCDDAKLAVEYCGLYWHSEFTGAKTRSYHLDKLKACTDAGYDLITVFESDNLTKVLALLKSKLRLNTRIFARNCDVVELTSNEAKTFNDMNHIHGHHGASYHIGLKYKNELVQVLSMGKARFNTAYEWECVRMTCKADITVIGGASKLFEAFKRNKNPQSIITYADRRFGDGKVYENCGFTRVNNSVPNYWYFNRSNPHKLYSRVVFQKHKLKELSGYDESLTEWEIMKASRYDRIWDCGNSKYIWNK